jgi:Domain of unknown function (DUF4835)
MLAIKKILILLSVICTQITQGYAQEMNAKVVVNGAAVQNTVDQKVFKAMEQGLQDFINKRKWTNDEWANTEKIECQFNITITKRATDVPDAYEAKLSIQASRPVYGTDYSSPILNYVDKDFIFKYIQYQPIDFNENRVAGNEALVSNLSATIAYYAYYILGLDYDTYKLKSGNEYYAKALNIVSNAPEGNGISGWKNEGTKNRYWLVDNIMSARFAAFREVLYNYHRNGLDAMAKNSKEGTDVILSTISSLYQINSEAPGSAILFLYFSTKNNEYYNILAKASMQEKLKVVPQLSMLDVPNATKYGELLKE